MNDDDMDTFDVAMDGPVAFTREAGGSNARGSEQQRNVRARCGRMSGQRRSERVGESHVS